MMVESTLILYDIPPKKALLWWVKPRDIPILVGNISIIIPSISLLKHIKAYKCI